jgi:hypothetical protein
MKEEATKRAKATLLAAVGKSMQASKQPLGQRSESTSKNEWQ